jgi:hypothetical protein
MREQDMTEAVHIVADHCFGEVYSRTEWALDVAGVAVHDLVEHLTENGWTPPSPAPAAGTPEPVEPREKPIFSAPNSEFLYREDEHGRVEAARADRPDEWGTTGWSSMAAVALAIGPLTEVSAVPSAEPGAGA